MMMPDLTQIFLEQITNECFPSGVQTRNPRERTFLSLRFHPDNREKQHIEIARKMCAFLGEGDYARAIGTTCQNVVRAIAEHYGLEMTEDGFDPNSLLQGERGQRGSWLEVYTWLNEYKFPRWRTADRIWEELQRQAQSRSNWMSFHDYIPIERRGAVIPPPIVNNRIEINKHLQSQIDFKDEDRYLLLLNRGLDERGAQTRYLFCPSSAFAPQIQPIVNLLYLPQPGAMSPDIKFDSVGTEEYIGILVREIPIEQLPWLNPNCQEPAPILDADRLYQLWLELEQQPDSQLYYQSFNVVGSEDLVR
jgi:hypothetical protein